MPPHGTFPSPDMHVYQVSSIYFKEIKNVWAHTLFSVKFIQGRKLKQRARKSNQFCTLLCLFVLLVWGLTTHNPCGPYASDGINQT